MKIYRATLQSVSPYGQTRHVDYKNLVPKGSKMTHEDMEKEFWRHKMHTNENGNVFIPCMAFKNCIAEAAKYLARQIPGKGKATFTKYFEAGILVTDHLVLPVKRDDVDGVWLHVPADGKRGGSKRVMKCYPCVQQWGGDVDFIIFEDEIITPEVFEEHLVQAGKFIGVGCFRPRNNGYWGRFEVKKVKVINA